MRITRLLLAAIAAVALPSARAAAPDNAGTAVNGILTPARVFASPDLSGPRARGVAMAPDGSAVTFLKAKDSDLTVTDLWIADVAGASPRLLIDGAALTAKDHVLSEAEKSLRERKGIQTHGVVEYAWDEQGRYIVVPVEGQLWLYERAGGTVRQLTHTASTDSDAKVSPRGHYVSFVRDDNLYVIATEGGAERALTQGGSEESSWGTAEFIAQEELDRRTGYWWSPDDTRIALCHVDQSTVDIIERPEINAVGATIVRQRYPRAGRPNARVELYVLDVATLARTHVDLGADADFYVARVDWSKNGRTLYVQRLSRDQRRLDLLAVDPSSGISRVLLSETSPHWVDVTNDLTPLHDGRFLWTSERSGYRHLYLYAGDGRLVRQLTHGDWPVAAVEGVDEARGVALIGASRDDPTVRRLYAVSWRTPADPVPLTPGGGWWTAVVAERGGSYAATNSDPATPPQTALYGADGKRIRWIEENRLDAAHPYYPYLARHRIPTFGTLTAADGQILWWSMRTPPGFDREKRYPVVVKVYGGPAGALVTRTWPSPEDQLLLEAGYILFSVDNRGTPNRSVAFKTALDRRFGTVEVEDQLAGVQFLETLPYVDPQHIGVEGWSNGGYMTLLLLTVPNSPFAAGIAGAPVTDWALYDTAYTERYMGTPAENPAGYRRADVLPRLPELRAGSLLILHGMADDNVTFDQSTRVFAALQSRGVPFETMVYPGLRHRAGWTPADKLHRTLLTLDFFRRALAPERDASR
jgi:dipeptidyl-peptidase-4